MSRARRTYRHYEGNATWGARPGGTQTGPFGNRAAAALRRLRGHDAGEAGATCKPHLHAAPRRRDDEDLA